MVVGFRVCGEYAPAIEMAKKLGFTALEPLWSRENSKTFPAMGKMAADYGIELGAVLTGVCELSIDDFKEIFDCCKAIGAKSFTGHPRQMGLDDAAAQAEFQERYTAGVELAESMGIKLALHSCGLNPEQWDLMFRLVPGLSLKYDPSFSAQAGRNYVAEILKYGSRIVHVHAKDEIDLGRTTDFNRGIIQFTYAPAGMGQINWGSVIAALYEVGFDEQIAIEPHSAYWWGAGLERGLLLAKRHLEQFIV